MNTREIPLNATNSLFYGSLVNAIETVNAQARVRLQKGDYVFENPNKTRLYWSLPRDQDLEIFFDYQFGNLQKGIIDFKNSPIVVLIRSQNNLCVKVKIKKITVLAGGAIDEENSSWNIMPPDSSCGTPQSELLGALEDVFVLNKDPGALFQGLIFRGSSTFRSFSSAPSAREIDILSKAQPVAKVTFFSTSETNKAFYVKLFDGASLQLPQSSGSIVFGKGSEVEFIEVEYDLRTAVGSGRLKNFLISAKDGFIKNGNTSFMLTSGSLLQFQNVRMAANGTTLEITDGVLKGALGSGTTISVGSVEDQISRITLSQGFDVLFSGLRMMFDGTTASISATSGSIKLFASSADLNFSKNMRLLLGNVQLHMIFTCGADAPEGCVPFHSSSDGTIVAKGHILPSTTVIRGGHIAMSNQNKLIIDNGSVQTSDLIFDTENRITPLYGSFAKIDISMLAQDWELDNKTKVGTASLRIKSDNLRIESADEAPTGNMIITAQITELTASGIGSFGVITAESSLEFYISRKFKDDMQIENGKITGKANFRGDGTNGTIRFILKELLFYRGIGSAKLGFFVDDLSTRYVLNEPRSQEGFPGGRTTVVVSNIAISANLAEKVGFDNIDIKIRDGEWKAVDVNNLDVKINIGIPTGKLVDIDVELGGGDLGAPYVRVCNPQLIVRTGAYTLNGKADFSLSDAKKFRAYGFSMTPAIDVEIDKGGCDHTAAAICGLIGMIAGPVGALAMAIACGEAVDEKKEELHSKISEDVTSWISNLKVDVGL